MVSDYAILWLYFIFIEKNFQMTSEPPDASSFIEIFGWAWPDKELSPSIPHLDAAANFLLPYICNGRPLQNCPMRGMQTMIDFTALCEHAACEITVILHNELHPMNVLHGLLSDVG